MGKTTYIRNRDGAISHVRVTSDDGRHSSTYEVDSSFFGSLFGGGKGRLVKVTDHRPDGQSVSYEADDSFLGLLLSGGRGKRK